MKLDQSVFVWRLAASSVVLAPVDSWLPRVVLDVYIGFRASQDAIASTNALRYGLPSDSNKFFFVKNTFLRLNGYCSPLF